VFLHKEFALEIYLTNKVNNWNSHEFKYRSVGKRREPALTNKVIFFFVMAAQKLLPRLLQNW